MRPISVANVWDETIQSSSILSRKALVQHIIHLKNEAPTWHTEEGLI